MKNKYRSSSINGSIHRRPKKSKGKKKKSLMSPDVSTNIKVRKGERGSMGLDVLSPQFACSNPGSRKNSLDKLHPASDGAFSGNESSAVNVEGGIVENLGYNDRF